MRRKNRTKKDGLPQDIFILPNLFTTLILFFGFCTVISMIATTVLMSHRLGLNCDENKVLMLIMLYALSFLMVSSIKYNSFKKPELFKKMSFNVLVASILFLIFIAAHPAIALFLLGTTYILSGPVTALFRYRAVKRKKTEVLKADEHRSSPV